MANVDILNYISDSNILRSTYDTDTNELDITDVPQNLNSVITLGQGGGSGPIELLKTIEITENVRAVNVEFTDYSDYDFICVYENFELNSTDWIYYVLNSTDYNANRYGPGGTKHEGIAVITLKNAVNNTNRTLIPYLDSYETSASYRANNVYLYTYNASNYIRAGGIVKLYGGKYADM